ncbi:MAG: Omp28-related outer membrane protein [Ignavibacteria bacterium]|nr:Omp28-related outer membrane protein [Ignavibacteria bacterium]
MNYPNTVVLGYHGAGSDPWQTYSAGIRGLFGFNAYPTGCVGRRSGVISRSAWNNQVVIQTSTIQPGVNIEVVNKSYDAGTRTLTATVRITANTDLTGDYYINYVMTENNLIYSQTGNSSCTGAPDYDHDHVVKSMMNGDAGELINSGNWTSGTTVTRNINYVVPSSPQIADVNNADLNIFVYLQSASISTSSLVQQATKTPVTGATGINNNNMIVDNYALSQNYPNPFNPSTTFTFSVPKSGNVSLKFYDALGSEVATYVDGFINAGSYSVEFDGSKLASGIYFYKLQAGDFSATKKMVLSK